MKVIIYGEPANKPMAALAQGFKMPAHKALWRNPNAFRAGEIETCDAVVVLGLQRAGRTIRDAYQARGVPVIVVDLGYWRRPEYFALGLGGLNSIPAAECPGDRAQAMGLIAPERRREDGDYILLIGQKPGDAQHTIRDMGAWALAQMARIREADPAAKIVWRPHPEAVFELSGVDAYHDPRSVSLDQSLAGARRLVTHNSTAAYAAFVAGVPVLSDETAVYAEVAQADQPTLQAFLNRVAYGQWTLQELADGTALGFLLPLMASHRKPPSVSTEQQAHEIKTLRGRIGLLEAELSQAARAGERLTAELQHAEEERRDLEGRLAEARRRILTLEQENLALKEAADDETARMKRSGKGRP